MYFKIYVYQTYDICIFAYELVHEGIMQDIY